MQTGKTAERVGNAPAPVATTARQVMVVDDSRLQRRILANLLGNWGFAVTEAESAARALELCREAPPDLVISDWMMPGMNGLEFCKAFRALDREDYGYFILLTSKNEKLHAAEGLDAGADDFLTKPVNRDELRARLNAGERILDMQRQLAEKTRIISQTLDKLQAAHDSIDSDLIEAKKLQQSLVRERQRDFGPARISLLLQPAGRVGGDLVGYYPIDATRFGCFAIDVSGHGISSALLTARIAGYLSPAVPEQNVALRARPDGRFAPRPLAEVAQHLNALVLAEVTTEHYFTMVLAQVELDTGRVSMVQAGHPHPVVQHADGSLTEVGPGGPPIGLLPDMTFEEFEVRLKPGDRLFIQSDGIVECADPRDRLLGSEGLFDILRRLQDVQGSAFLEAVVWMLAEYGGGGEFADDISAVLVEYSGRGPIR